MRILAVGDSYMPPRYFQEAFASLELDHEVEYFQVEDKSFTPNTPSELRIKEYQGVPRELSEHMAGVEALVVQGAPVTDAVLQAGPQLRIVGCARGGPVNVDLEAVNARKLPLVNTPGKNAQAVADQTIAFLIMLARGFPRGQRFLDEGHQLKDNWEGAKFIGSDLRRHTLGVVGFGLIGHEVARRALPFGMEIVAYDPYMDIDPADGVRQVESLDQLLRESDFVSLHARATKDNADMFDAATFAKMKPGAYFVNTARETLVDEDALDAALESGHLGGAALDVVRQGTEGGRHRLLRHSNVVMTPHVGGATHETLLQGAEMIADELRRFAAGKPPRHLVNPEALEL
ncbi:MAG: NAD(P)-dependent oxidoreductase [Acidimicrobiales bacterium]